MIDAEYRERERFVLLSGAAAVSLVMLAWILGAAGHGLGSFGSRVVATVIVLYLCARLWGHGRTLLDREVHEGLGKTAAVAAPIVFFLLFLQTWTQAGIHLSLGLDFLPHVEVSAFTRLEWTADLAIFTFFLATAIAVWTDEANAFSARLSKVAYAVLGFLGVDLLAAIWGVVSIVPQWRLLVALVALALGGTVLIATVRRIERLDELDEPAEPGHLGGLLDG